MLVSGTPLSTTRMESFLSPELRVVFKQHQVWAPNPKSHLETLAMRLHLPGSQQARLSPLASLLPFCH